jgi:ParB/RepB/Spo0J family partition protein
MTAKPKFAMVPIGQLRLIDNVRTDPGDLTDLVDSIRQHGILEPIVGCPTEDRQHVDILMGQRRYEAAKLAGETEVPCVLRPRPSHRGRLLMQLAENLERSDMSPIDEAHAFRDLQSQGLTVLQVAKAVHKSTSWVQHRLDLLALPVPIRAVIHSGVLPPGLAREVPRELRADKPAIKRLAGYAPLDATTLRQWVHDEVERSRNGTRRIRHTSVGRTIGVNTEFYELAREGARLARCSIGEWVEKAIVAHAKRRRA